MLWFDSQEKEQAPSLHETEEFDIFVLKRRWRSSVTHTALKSAPPPLAMGHRRCCLWKVQGGEAMTDPFFDNLRIRTLVITALSPLAQAQARHALGSRKLEENSSRTLPPPAPLGGLECPNPRPGTEGGRDLSIPSMRISTSHLLSAQTRQSRPTHLVRDDLHGLRPACSVRRGRWGDLADWQVAALWQPRVPYAVLRTA